MSIDNAFVYKQTNDITSYWIIDNATLAIANATLAIDNASPARGLDWTGYALAMLEGCTMV